MLTDDQVEEIDFDLEVVRAAVAHADAKFSSDALLALSCAMRLRAEVDELRTRASGSPHALTIKATAATIHEVAGWGGNVTSAEMHELAEHIRTDDPKDWTCCPLCEEVRCDESCPLLPVRRDLGVM